MCIELRLHGSWTDSETKSVEISSRLHPPDRKSADDCIDVHANTNYTLEITLKRKNRSNNLRAHSPLFLRGKDEGWFLVLGDIAQRELWALKRAAGINNQPKLNQLEFTAPSFTGRLKLALFMIFCLVSSLTFVSFFFSGRTKVTFYLMSDCYIGFDQQYDIHLNVIP